MPNSSGLLLLLLPLLLTVQGAQAQGQGRRRRQATFNSLETSVLDAARLGAERCQEWEDADADEDEDERPAWWCAHGGGKCVKGCKTGLALDEACACNLPVDPNGACALA